jgi:hypothetical protein
VSALGEWDLDDDALEPAAAPPSPAGDPAPAPTLYYPTVEAFVHQLLAPTFRRHLDGGRTSTWCPQWWRHPEGILRLEALWRAWEFLRLDPATGMSVWLRDHADHHMAVLMSHDGPFKGCSSEKGHSTRLQPLPLEEPPVGLFDASA